MSEKIIVQFKATGSAPILKQPFFKLGKQQKFSTVIQFLRKLLQMSESDPLFVYINSSFAPLPDEIVSQLYDCFGTDGSLICHYATGKCLFSFASHFLSKIKNKY